jgi:hypothetical protein
MGRHDLQTLLQEEPLEDEAAVEDIPLVVAVHLQVAARSVAEAVADRAAALDLQGSIMTGQSSAKFAAREITLPPSAGITLMSHTFQNRRLQHLLRTPTTSTPTGMLILEQPTTLLAS